MHMPGVSATRKTSAPGFTVRLPEEMRDQVLNIARSEYRSAASYIQKLVAADLQRRAEAERVVRVYVAEGASSWDGHFDRGENESDEMHAERVAVARLLLGFRETP